MCVIDVNITYILIALFLYLFHGIYYLSFRDTSRNAALIRGTQGECSSKPLKHSTVKRILVLKR